MTPLVRDQWSNKYAFWRANVAIKKENVLVPPCSILFVHSGLASPVIRRHKRSLFKSVYVMTMKPLLEEHAVSGLCTDLTVLRGGSIRIEPSQQLLDDCTHKRNSKRKVGKPIYH